ncbi:MAG: amidohydrolase [Firmicutes bacterium]|nr:amidohydrolase [Bacillota bacterium]
MDNILDRAKAIQEEIVAIRRDIHAHPEMGHQEVRTSKLIAETLQKYGVDKIETPTPTSVVATITGKAAKGDGLKCVALRTDIDALGIQEETGLDFASTVPNMMHACGHDMHCAMMLGNAKLLTSMRDQFGGTVKLIFQHSEDTFPGGSRELVAEGVMKGVDAILGLHVISSENEKCGTIGIKDGPITTSADEYEFVVTGPGGHGSMPNKVPDPILAAAEIIVMLQQVQARAVPPLDASIIMMNKIQGGHAPNIIADKVTMVGNARAYKAEVRKIIEETVYKVARGVEEISGCKVQVNATFGYDPCFNDPGLYSSVLPNLKKVLGEEKVEIYAEPMAFSEDFSFYSTLTGVPALFLLMEAGNLNGVQPLHNAQVTFNEDALPYGMTTMVSSALMLLGNR